MEDRIQINGVWYIREDLQQDIEEDVELDTTDFEGCAYENRDYCWEATRIQRTGGDFYEDIDIKFTDKRNKPWVEDHWDNNNWFRGLLENNPESLKDAQDMMCADGIKNFKAFLNILKEKSWLKHEIIQSKIQNFSTHI